MSTLKELIDTHGLPLKVSYEHRNSFHSELVAASKEHAIGFLANNYPTYYTLCSNGWSLYTEPKPKVKRWLWADKQGRLCKRMASEEEMQVTDYYLNQFTIKVESVWQEFEA